MYQFSTTALLIGIMPKEESVFMDNTEVTKGKASLNIATILVLLGIIAAIVIVLQANSGRSLNQVFFKGRSESPVPTGMPAVPPAMVDEDIPATPENGFSPAVQTIDQYYKYINEARSSSDLRNAWNLLTTAFKCNPGDRCNFVRYQTHWWQIKVHYKLYDCGSNTIDADLIYYPRKSSGPTASAQTEYIRYQLVDEGGQLKLESGESIKRIRASCELAVSVP